MAYNALRYYPVTAFNTFENKQKQIVEPEKGNNLLLTFDYLMFNIVCVHICLASNKFD